MFKPVLKLHLCHNLSTPLGMSKKILDAFTTLSHQYNAQHLRQLCTARSQSKWDLFSAVCIERRPIITRPMQKIETDYYELLKRIEFEHSKKSEHELRLQIEKEGHSTKESDIDIEDVVRQTAHDFEDLAQAELESFKLAPRTSESGESESNTQISRKLSKSLVLLLRQQVGNSYFWIPPQGIRQEGETMRQTAERVLKDLCGSELYVKFYGNAPCGFYKYKYPEILRKDGSYGAKVFYFLVRYSGGQVLSKAQHQWLDQEELEKVMPHGIHKAVSQFLIPDG